MSTSDYFETIAVSSVVENGGGKGMCVGERERGKRRREKERGGRFPD
jgi:hypothetical protein